MKDNLQIQCNIYQNTKGVFHRTRTLIMWKQKTPNRLFYALILRKQNKA